MYEPIDVVAGTKRKSVYVAGELAPTSTRGFTTLEQNGDEVMNRISPFDPAHRLYNQLFKGEHTITLSGAEITAITQEQRELEERLSPRREVIWLH